MSPAVHPVAPRSRALSRLRRAVAVLIALALTALLGTAVWLYHEQFRDAEQKLKAAVGVAQEHALRVIDTNEMLLARMLDLLGDAPDSAWLERSRELHDRLNGMAAGLPQVQGLFVNGADARMLGSNRAFPPNRQIDFSDREFMRVHASGKGPRVFITEQLVSRSTGERFFDVSRRRSRPDGSFAGTVNVSLRPEYFEMFWREMEQATPGIRLALVRSDGRLIARSPGDVAVGTAIPANHPLMQHIAAGELEGAFEAESPFDKSSRLITFRRLGEHSIFVTASFARAAIVAEWAGLVGLLAVFAIPLVAVLGFLSVLEYRRTRDELEAAERLDEEKARRQQAEIALAHAQRLETAGRLAGGVAHELNNLLMIVASHAHLLRKAPPHSPPSQSGIAAIERTIAAGRRLTRQLLALSGRQVLSPAVLRLQEQVPAAMTLLRPSLPSNIKLSLDVAADTAPIVADREELELAIINLSLNARDAMPTGGVLKISARNVADGDSGAREGEHVVLIVSDTGSGIDPAILDRVREPLFTTKPQGLGSGLGLTQVQRLCENTSGRLDIESRFAGGTNVCLYFPRAATTAASAESDDHESRAA